jgi:hypothetical protein
MKKQFDQGRFRERQSLSSGLVTWFVLEWPSDRITRERQTSDSYGDRSLSLWGVAGAGFTRVRLRLFL